MTDLERDLLAALGAGTLTLPARRPEPVRHATDPADSPSETVRRHAETFRTQSADSEITERTPPRRARPIGLGEVGSPRTKRGQTVRLAEAYGWTWTAHAAGDPATSIVVRFRRPGAFPWHHEHAVAHWAGPASGKSLPFATAFAWQVYGGRLDRPRGVDAVPDEPVEGEPLPVGWVVPVALSVTELAEHLVSPRYL